METEIVKINAQEFGLTDETAKNIQQQFKPMLDKMVELENEFNKIVALDVSDPKTSKLAKDLRLKYVKVRTGTAEIHKQQKAFYLNGGRFVDGWKNAQLFASQGKEEALEKIEKHFENLEKERLQKLQAERIELIRPYVEDVSQLELSSMAGDVFDAYLSAKRQAYQDRIEAEKKAELERIAKEKAEEEERQRIRIENERLKAENEAKEKQLAEERAKAEAERKAIEEKARLEREEAEKKAAEERAKQDELLRLEKEKQAKLEAELKAKKEAEAKAEAERLAEIEKQRKEAEILAKEPIKKQLLAWIDTFALPTPESHLLNNDIALRIAKEFDAFKKLSKEVTEKM